MSNDRRDRLQRFAQWCQQHIKGDEKSEAQIFLDRFFQAFGHDGLFEAGGSAEFRIKKAAEDGGGTSFADCVWKPHVLIEMKKRGEDLSRHYRQAFDYWTRLVPGRPHYVVLCNFDELWVYDFDVQLDTPVDKVPVNELPDRFGPLAFLFPTHEEPVFGNDNEKVTREAAGRLGVLFRKLAVREDVGRPKAQRFVLQILVALFAEDIGLLERYTIERLANDCHTPQDSYELFGGLFQAMNEVETRDGGRYKGVRYFNGGLFADPARVELAPDELNQIKEAAREDWSKVRPEIFGTIFEQTCNQDERHAFGAHFTSAVDIYKIIRPTITDPWETLIDKAYTLKRLRELHQQMQAYRVLDPACGSGNFLYLAYRELKRLEKKLIDKLAEVSRKQGGGQGQFSFVTTRQFFGMDINPFAVELAKVTMMLAHKLAIDELHIDEPALPLDNLDLNIRCADALISDTGIVVERIIANHEVKVNELVVETRCDSTTDFKQRAQFLRQTTWPDADVIIGNPPFLGAKRLKPEHGADYVNTVRKLYPDVPGMADYCVYWFRRAHDHLPTCTPEEPFRGRAGLVGTQNIRNNKSREGGLDHITASGTVVEAVDNQPWSGEANVHVSIANWVKHELNVDTHDLLIPDKKKLWFRVDAKSKVARKRGQGSANKEYELDFRNADFINSALSDQTDVSGAIRLSCNYQPQVCFNGQFPRCKKFEITPSLARDMLSADERNIDVVFPCLIGSEFLTHGKPKRYVIDFQKRDIIDSQRYQMPYAWVEKEVLPYVQAYADKEREKTGSSTGQDQNWLQTWWQHFRCRDEMVRSFNDISRYLVCSDTTKRPVFAFVNSDIRPDHKLRVFAFDDDYSFGLLQSYPHWLWFIVKCSKLNERFNYTSTSVFDTFP